MTDHDLDAIDPLVNARWWVGNLHSATSGAIAIVEDLLAEVEKLRAVVERLKANQPDDGEDDHAVMANPDVTRVSVPSHTIVLNGRVPKTQALDQAQEFYRDEIAYAHTALVELEKGLATVSWPESESKPSDTPPESTTDQTTPNGA